VKLILLTLLKLIGSVAFAYIAYAALGLTLDRLSNLFEMGAGKRNAIETLLALLSPMTFGLLIFAALAIGFYLFIPKLFPRIWG
jgi:hypothetical protein